MILVRDLKSGRANKGSMDVIAHKPQQLRMEITGPFAIPLASFAMDQNKATCAVHTEKKYFSGAATPESLANVMKVEFNPKYFLNMFFDEPIAEKNWSCLQGSDKLVSKCERLSDKTSVEWKERSGERKRLVVLGNGFEIQILVKSFTTNVQALSSNGDNLFLIQPPSGYKTINF